MKDEIKRKFIDGAAAIRDATAAPISARAALDQWAAQQGLRRAVYATFDEQTRADLAAAVERKTGTTEPIDQP